MRKIKAIITSFVLSFLILLNLGINSASATGVYDLPVINSGEDVWVWDNADVISKTTEGELTNQLRDLAKNTGNETRIVVINRLDYDQTIDSLTNELFSTWYPTPEAQNNQTLFVLDTLTNRIALRSGEGLTSLLTPTISESILKETATIPLKNLQYNQALTDVSDRLVAVLSGKEDPGPPQVKELNIDGTFATSEETDDRSATIWMIVLLALATLIPMVTYFWYVGFPGN
ncbi:photosystem II repair protein Psb32 [Geminocystis sp. GBBB08]|uniref:photosystem II repair protein Psb32 n=1 Tax=Geminocystis sp. GBBB08 TaxID=2604140 RepID=UPI0027E232CC|nr:TPM domain-containing protein [Geminocystis sp. GBBB08]MBL1210691.1 YgcG family protein [Geminocystis sp. GBBB08]